MVWRSVFYEPDLSTSRLKADRIIRACKQEEPSLPTTGSSPCTHAEQYECLLHVPCVKKTRNEVTCKADTLMHPSKVAGRKGSPVPMSC